MARNLKQVPFSRIFHIAAAFGLTSCLAAGGTAALLAAPVKEKKPTAAPVKAASASKPATVAPLREEQRIVHLLNRAGFGPRPGDVEKVKTMGIGKYLDLQLHPERIDETGLDSRIAASCPVLDDSWTELATAYYGGIRAGLQFQQIVTKIAETARAGNADEETMRKLDPAGFNGNEKAVRERIQLVQKYATPEQMAEMTRLLKERQKAGRQGVRAGQQQLQTAKVVRAVESDKQLYEVLVDFWSNHFNIDMSKGQCRSLKVGDEREVARKFALGKFRDLLGASAKSPAMLFYLDNQQSQAPPPMNPRQQRMMERAAANGNMVAQAMQKRGRGGVNENYARELMELHTLGVEGGYTQKDVQEVARCLTGWGYRARPDGAGGGFEFSPRKHDDGEKTVLGRTIAAGGGIQDGEAVLDLLASHPSTMRFVSTKLCKRFVSDAPPKSLVDKCVATWKRTDGDIREVVHTILTSPEFYSAAAYRQKIKSPFEYAVSSVRALDGHVRLPDEAPGVRIPAGGRMQAGAGQRTVVAQVGTMGQPLFQCNPPTGYPEDSKKWVSSGALISRLNFALGLTNGNLVDVELPRTEELFADGELDPKALISRLENDVLHVELSPATRKTLLGQATMVPASDASMVGVDSTRRLVALVLGSPEFQRR